MDAIELTTDAIKLLHFLSRGDATRSEIGTLRLPHQRRVLTQLVSYRLIDWKSHQVARLPRLAGSALN